MLLWTNESKCSGIFLNHCRPCWSLLAAILRQVAILLPSFTVLFFNVLEFIWTHPLSSDVTIVWIRLGYKSCCTNCFFSDYIVGRVLGFEGFSVYFGFVRTKTGIKILKVWLDWCMLKAFKNQQKLVKPMQRERQSWVSLAWGRSRRWFQ